MKSWQPNHLVIDDELEACIWFDDNPLMGTMGYSCELIIAVVDVAINKMMGNPT